MIAPLALLLAIAQTPSEPAAPPPATPAASGALPSPTPIAFTYTYTPDKQPGSPQILEVQLNSERLRPHGFFAIRILTTPDVVRVTTGSGKREGAVPMIGPGEFLAQSTLPGAPDIARVRIKLRVTATTAGGESTVVNVPVIFG
jgi:hypothetical protein